MWHAHDGMGWWMLFGGVFWLIFLATFVWLLLSLLSPRARAGERQGVDLDGEDAREIARRRYASGEIDRSEFQQILRDLGSQLGNGGSSS